MLRTWVSLNSQYVFLVALEGLRSAKMQKADDTQDIFLLYDQRGDEKIELTQIGDVLRSLGLNPTQKDIKKLVDEFGADRRMSYEEFLPIFRKQKKTNVKGTHEQFAEGFRIYDMDNNGLVSGAEIRYLLTSLGEPLSDSEVELLLDGMKDAYGMVNYEELIRQIMEG